MEGPASSPTPARPRRWRRLAALAATVLAALVGVLSAPASASARPVDPPVIVGFTIDQAEAALRAWAKDVVIAYEPSLEKLPSGFNRDNVLVASSQLLNPVTTPNVAAASPQVLVRLGSTLPSLVGLTAAEAARTLAPWDVRVSGLPTEAGQDWIVRASRPAAGTVVPFGSVVTVVLVLPPSPTATSATSTPTIVVEPRRGPDPVLIAAVGGGSGLLLLVAALVTTSAVRRGRRRRRPPGPERIEVHGYPGSTVGPHLVGPALAISVRLEPHHSAPSITVEEAHR